jgi:hypothetical protein
MNNRKKLAALLAALALAVGLSGSTVAHAETDPVECVYNYALSSPAGYNETSGHVAVMGLSAVTRSLTLSARSAAGGVCDVPTDGSWRVSGAPWGFGDIFVAEGNFPSLTDSVVLVDVPSDNSFARTANVQISTKGPILGDSWVVKNTQKLTLKRRTVWTTANATPEPVAKFGDLTVKALLTRADWSDGEYEPFIGRTVRLQVHAPNTAWDDTAVADTDVTDFSGKAVVVYNATSDSVYRLHYGGNKTSGHSDSRGDLVRLKR